MRKRARRAPGARGLQISNAAMRHRAASLAFFCAATLAAAAPRPAIAGPAAAVPVPGRPGELRGRVTRSDGTPVPAFLVNGVRFSDSQGSFKILTPPEGEFRIVIRADGFAPTVIHVTGASGKKLSIPDIFLGSGEDVIGEVLDAETGLPVVAARVALADPAQISRLRLVRPERLSEAATTGSGGFFRLARVPRGRLLLVVQHPDYLPEFVAINTREAGPTILLHRGGSIAGTVRGSRGEPVSGARVLAISDEVEDAQEVAADAEGRFALSGLRPGQYVVLARAAGAGSLRPQPVAVADGRVASVGFVARGTRMRMELPDVDVAPPPAGEAAPAPRRMEIPEVEVGPRSAPSAPASQVAAAR